MSTTKEQSILKRASHLIRQTCDEYESIATRLETAQCKDSEQISAMLWVAEEVLGSARLAVETFCDGNHSRAERHIRDAEQTYKHFTERVRDRIAEETTGAFAPTVFATSQIGETTLW